MGEGGTAFRTFRDGDEEAILRLLSDSTAACTLEEWAWLFPVEERGRAIVVGERDGQVRSLCAAAPLTVRIGGSERPGAEILKLVSLEREELPTMVEHFVQTFSAGGRFAVALVSLGAGAEAPPGFVVPQSARVAALVRERPATSPFGRLRYRAEPARDWEPRLDGLWQRARDAYPEAVVRDTDRALRRFTGHPTTRHHRFLVFPRFSNRAVAFAVFAVVGERCRWLDLVWDHDHPGALDLLAHLSARLVAQLGAAGEELWLGGDDSASAVLAKRGFEHDPLPSPPLVAARSLAAQLDVERFVGGAYLTAADAEAPLP